MHLKWTIPVIAAAFVAGALVSTSFAQGPDNQCLNDDLRSEASDSVYLIMARKVGDPPENAVIQGTATLIDRNGYFLTVNHVAREITNRGTIDDGEGGRPAYDIILRPSAPIGGEDIAVKQVAWGRRTSGDIQGDWTLLKAVDGANLRPLLFARPMMPTFAPYRAVSSSDYILTAMSRAPDGSAPEAPTDVGSGIDCVRIDDRNRLRPGEGVFKGQSGSPVIRWEAGSSRLTSMVTKRQGLIGLPSAQVREKLCNALRPLDEIIYDEWAISGDRGRVREAFKQDRFDLHDALDLGCRNGQWTGTRGGRTVPESLNATLNSIIDTYSPPSETAGEIESAENVGTALLPRLLRALDETSPSFQRVDLTKGRSILKIEDGAQPSPWTGGPGSLQQAILTNHRNRDPALLFTVAAAIGDGYWRRRPAPADRLLEILQDIELRALRSRGESVAAVEIIYLLSRLQQSLADDTLSDAHWIALFRLRIAIDMCLDALERAASTPDAPWWRDAQRAVLPMLRRVEGRLDERGLLAAADELAILVDDRPWWDTGPETTVPAPGDNPLSARVTITGTALPAPAERLDAAYHAWKGTALGEDLLDVKPDERVPGAWRSAALRAAGHLETALTLGLADVSQREDASVLLNALLVSAAGERPAAP